MPRDLRGFKADGLYGNVERGSAAEQTATMSPGEWQPRTKEREVNFPQ